MTSIDQSELGIDHGFFVSASLETCAGHTFGRFVVSKFIEIPIEELASGMHIRKRTYQAQLLISSTNSFGTCKVLLRLYLL